MTKFRAGANNFQSKHRNFRKEQELSNQARNQKRFHVHYLQIQQSRNLTIIGHTITEKLLTQNS